MQRVPLIISLTIPVSLVTLSHTKSSFITNLKFIFPMQFNLPFFIQEPKQCQSHASEQTSHTQNMFVSICCEILVGCCQKCPFLAQKVVCPVFSLLQLQMCHLTMEICSEKCVIRWFRRRANVIDNIAYYTPRLYGIAYCYYATNLYSVLLYWIL
jgi:hypothetical protein